MNCKNCGCVLQPADTFCPSCGKNVPAPGTVSASAPGAATAFAPAFTPQAIETSGKATLSLICGIFFFVLPVAIIAIIMGHIALSEIKRSAGRIAGQGRAIAGLVLGYMGILALPVILIVAAIAIPNLLRARMVANETSTSDSIRIINAAEANYALEHPDVGYVCELPKLAGAGALDPRLVSGIHNGYSFSITGCQPDQGSVAVPPADSMPTVTVREGAAAHYQIIAIPVKPGNTGNRMFCSDETGAIRAIAASASPEDCFSADPL